MKTLTAFVGLLLITHANLLRGETFDYTATPKATDNYTAASFRCLNPDPQVPPDYILVFIPGTNGDARSIVSEAKFQAIAKACHAVIVGCSFQGIEKGYDKPSGGTGQALDEAISFFATKLNLPSLPKAPLLLIGHSQGGNFTYNYVCWKPERVKAFAATKWMIPDDPTAASFQVPGFLATGEKDSSGRVESISKAFAAATGKHAKWAFLYEKDAGHDMSDALFNFIQAYFTAVCQPATGAAPLLLNVETGNTEPADSVAAGAAWFPDQHSADIWRTLHKPTPLADLTSLMEKQNAGQ